MRILLVARHYPPAISGGARRPAMLAQALRQLSHDVFVIAPRLLQGENGLAVSHPAESRDQDGVARKTGAPDPAWRRAQRLLTLWPDPERWWADRVIEKADDAVRRFGPDLVITTSPPESIHHAGYHWAQTLDCLWMADFRDSWLADPMMPERRLAFRRIGERWLFRRWLGRVDLATAPSAFIENELEALRPSLRTFRFKQVSETPRARTTHDMPGWDDLPDGTIRLLHSGSFTQSDPKRQLAPVLDRLQSEAPPQARLCIAGWLSESERAEVEAHTQAVWLGLVPRRDVLGLQLEADALLLIAADGATAVPGKLSEYRAAGRPIVALGDGPWHNALETDWTVQLDQLDTLEKGSAPKGLALPDPIAHTQALLDALLQGGD